MYCYALSPTDFWAGWQDYKEFCASVAREDNGLHETAKTLLRVGDLLHNGQAYCREKLHWEGDMRQGPFFSALPTGDSDCAFVIAWKQDNNGTTYVVSEIELPWLK